MEDESELERPEEVVDGVGSEEESQVREPGLWLELWHASGIHACGVESLIYCLFVVLLTIVGVTRVTADHARLIAHAKHEFVDRGGFGDVVSAAEFWRYAEGHLVRAALGNSSFGFQNVLLTTPRLRQLKVRNDSCVTRYDATNWPDRVCYDFFSDYAEDTSTFGSGNGTAWVHSTEQGMSFSGVYGHYHAGGFHAHLTLDGTAVQVVRELRDGDWVGDGTRVLIVEFAAYNANTRLLCIVRLLLEFPPQGGAATSWYFWTAQLPRYQDDFRIFIVVCDIVLFVLALLLLVQGLHKVARQGSSYPWWSWQTAWYSMFVLAVAWACLNVQTYHQTSTILGSRSASFSDYAWLEFIHRRFVDTEGFLLWAAWLGTLSYLRVSRSARMVGRALLMCWHEVVFVLILLGFVVMAYIFFANYVFNTKASFSTLGAATFSLMNVPMVPYEDLEAPEFYLGPVFYLSYVFLVFFIICSLTAAVVFKAYSETPRDDAPSVFGVLKKFFRPSERAPYIRERLLEMNVSEKEVALLWAKLRLDPSSEDGFEEALSALRAAEEVSPGSAVVSRHEATSLDERVSAITSCLETSRERLVATMDAHRPAAE